MNAATPATPTHAPAQPGDAGPGVLRIEFDTDEERTLIASLTQDQLATTLFAGALAARVRADEFRAADGPGERHTRWCQTHEAGCQSGIVGFGDDGFAFVTADGRGTLLTIARMNHKGPDGAVVIPLADAPDMLDEVGQLIADVQEPTSPAEPQAER